jgi:phosphotransferase system enzyme I (PtsI)
LVKRTIEAAHSEGKLVEMCGEMAANPLFIPILLGLGLDGFSMSGVVIPEIKEIIRSLTLDEAKVIAEDALKLTTTEGIIRLIKRRLGRRFKHIFEEVGEM